MTGREDEDERDEDDGPRTWEDEEAPPLLEHTPEQLRALGDDELLALLREGDVLTPAVADEVLARGERLRPRLVALLDDDAVWEEEWPVGMRVVHAAMLLAGIGGAEAAPPLLRALRRFADEETPFVESWHAALLRRVPIEAWSAEVLGWIEARHLPLEVRLAALEAGASGALRDPGHRTAFIAACARVRGKAKEPREELPATADFWLGCLRRWGHPDEVEQAVGPGVGRVSEEDGAEEHLAEERAMLEVDPLEFYSPEAREMRWAPLLDEEEGELEEGWGPDDEDDPGGHVHGPGCAHDHDGPEWQPTEPGVTIVRTEAKIGRNDPCPCGSGKKHKKCCGAAKA